jgi:tRNA U34 5-methylaminomethyl-2-thiouridine-forming methyltransferase MnmC
MQQIVTKDQSITYYNEQYQETYHSRSGAEEESIKKFAIPALGKLDKIPNQITILDVCFGLGYNTAAIIDKIKKLSPGTKVQIYALENDPEIIKNIQKINSNFKSYNIIKQLTPTNTEVQEGNVQIKLVLGDATKTLNKVPNNISITLHDPFSPKKCPELWTKEIFKKIYKLSSTQSVLVTYSCARIVRDNLKYAGFSVEDGPSVGRRAPSTIATKNIN